MLEGESAAIIAGASAIGGGLIVAVSNYVVTLKQGRDARTDEVKRAMIELLNALALMEQRLRQEPNAGPVVRTLNERMAKHRPNLDHSIGLVRRRLLDPRLDELSAALSHALSAATVVVPREVLPALSAITELMGKVEQCNEKWWEEWNDARTTYTLWCREIAGSGLAPSARARIRSATDPEAALR